MRALCWFGKGDVRVQNVPDPTIVNPHDAIVRVTRTALCGSDLHLYGGFIPTMERGDVLGHEFMGEIVEIGRDVHHIAQGDRVVVPFVIACGKCWFCEKELSSFCDNTNPNGWMTDKAYGAVAAGLFGYSHMMGGYAGGQAEYVRVPFADVGCLKIEDGLDDEQVLFLSDILPTAYQAAEQCDIQPGHTVAVWGLGPVGQLAVKCAVLLGAEKVIGIDDVPERLEMARRDGGCITIDMSRDNPLSVLHDITGGRGADACIDAVGMEAHGMGIDGVYDRVKQSLKLQTDRPTALRYAIMACRKGGVLSVPGVYGGLLDKVPLGAAFAKGLTFRMGQTHVHRYMAPLLEQIRGGQLDASSIITHRIGLEELPDAYEMFRDKRDKCVKVVVELKHGVPF